MKKILYAMGIVPLFAILVWSGINLFQVISQEFFAGWIDLSNSSILNFFNPFTSTGGSAAWYDILLAGPGAVGGSAIRMFQGAFYFGIATFSFKGVEFLWGLLKFK